MVQYGLQTAIRNGDPVDQWPIHNARDLCNVLGVPSLCAATDRLCDEYGIGVTWHTMNTLAGKRITGIRMSVLAQSGHNAYIRTRDLYFACTAGELLAAIAVLQEG
jgi:hypothetical protein